MNNLKPLFSYSTVLLLFLIVNISFAETYYVATTGNDGNPGTEASPWETIQKAANTLIAGDIVYIKAGAYLEVVSVQNSGTSNNYITFSAYPGDEQNVSIAGKFSIIGKSYIKVTGLRRDEGTLGFYVEGPSTGVILDGNYTYGTTSSGISVWGVPWNTDPGSYNNINSIIIKNNIIEKACDGGWDECITLANGVNGFEITNNTIKNGGDDTNGGEGIDLKEGCSDGIISHNTIFNLTRRGIYLDGGRNAHPFAKPIVENIEIFNNVVHNNEGTGIAIMTEGPGDVRNIKIYNNILYDNTEDGVMFYKHPEGTGVVHDITTINNTVYHNSRNGILSNFSTSYNMIIRNNISYLNHDADIWLQSGGNISDHNITVDPKFVDAAAGNFHLQEDSPAIDAGTSTDAPTEDFDGNSRVGAVDVGVFEFENIVLLQTKIFLEGPYSLSSNEMTIGIYSEIPKTSPYEDARTVENIPPNIVDWVFIELRETTNGDAITSKSAFLHKDGRVVADDGTTWEVKLNAPDGNYYVVIKHRNHLSVMSTSPQTFGGS